MLLSFNGINDQLENYISKNYEFRKNLLNRILGRDLLEYKRFNALNWSPISNFVKKERRKIIAENTSKTQDAQTLYPNWLIKKVALRKIESADVYIRNENYLKIIDEKPVKISNVKTINRENRVPVILQEGDKCFVSFGKRKKFFKTYYTALPAIVESVRNSGGDDYYNVFILKLDKRKNRVEYFGRHLVLNTEVGRTPEEAAKNVAVSLSIY